MVRLLAVSLCPGVDTRVRAITSHTQLRVAVSLLLLLSAAICSHLEPACVPRTCAQALHEAVRQAGCAGCAILRCRRLNSIVKNAAPSPRNFKQRRTALGGGSRRGPTVSHFGLWPWLVMLPSADCVLDCFVCSLAFVLSFVRNGTVLSLCTQLSMAGAACKAVIS